MPKEKLMPPSGGAAKHALPNGYFRNKRINSNPNSPDFVREYYDGFIVTINNTDYIFDGYSEADTAHKLLTALGISIPYEEVANNISY